MALFTSGSPGLLPTPREQVGKTNTTGRDLYDAEEERRRKLLAQQRQQRSAQEAAGTTPPKTGDAPTGMVAQPTTRAPGTSATPASSAQMQTFAEMQAQGRARPAPPPPASMTPASRPMTAGGSQSAERDAMLSQLQQQLGLAQPAGGVAAPAAAAGTSMDALRDRRLEQAMAERVGGAPIAPPLSREALQDRLAMQMGIQAEAMPSGTMAGAAMSSDAPDERLTQTLSELMGMTPAMETSALATLDDEDDEPLALGAATTGTEEPAAAAPATAPAAAPAAAAPAAAPAAPDAAPDAVVMSAPPVLLDEEEDGDMAMPAVAPAGVPAAAVAAPAAAPVAAPAAAPMAAPAVAPMATPRAAPMASSMGGVPSAPRQAVGVGPTGAAFATFGGSDLSRTLQGQLMEQLQLLQNAPSRFEDPGFKAAREASIANLQAQFGAEQQRLDEEMARRGLFASSIASGRMGDLSGQQARALATMEGDLLKEQSKTQAEDRRLMLEQMSQLANMAGTQSRDEFMANLESMKTTGQLDMMAKELQLKAELEGRSLDLQSARDQVAAELGRGQLQLGYSELQSRESMQLKQFGFDERMQDKKAELEIKLQEGRITADERMQLRDLESRETIAKNEITSREGMQDKDIAATDRRQLAQFGFDERMQDKKADLEIKLQTDRITADERIQLKDLESREKIAKNQIDLQRGEGALDRGLRETLGMAEVSGFYRDETGKLVPTATNQQQRNAFLAQVATALSGMDETARNKFLASQPELAKLLGRPPATQSVGSGTPVNSNDNSFI